MARLRAVVPDGEEHPEHGAASQLALHVDGPPVHEDEAASALAQALAGEHVRIEAPFTGRSNLYSQEAGLLVVDRAKVDRLNRVDPAITVATLPEFAVVEPGRMVATVKIIPFAVERRALEAATALGRALRVAPFRPMKAKTLPRGTLKETLSTAHLRPK